MSGFANAIIGGAEALIRKAMRSPNYVTGSTGWTVNKDGSAEFNDVVVRGEFDVGTATRYVKIYVAPAPISGPVVAFNVDSGTFDDGYIEAVYGTTTAFAALLLSSPAAPTQDPAQVTLTSSNGTNPATVGIFSSLDVNGGLTVEPTVGNVVLQVDETGTAAAVPIAANQGITLPLGKYVKRGGLATVAFANGWTNFGSTYQPVRYAEMPEGWGALVGVASGGTATNGTVVCTIPNCWPANDHTFDVPCNNGKHAQIIVRQNGNIELSNPDTGVTWFSFGEIRWPIAGF